MASYRAGLQSLAGDAIPVKVRVEKRSKYGNAETSVDGKKFDSRAEAHRYCELRRMQDAGLISDLRCQVSFQLVPSVTICGKKMRPMKFTADFCFTQEGKLVVEDVKGMATRDYKMRRILMKFILGIDVVEYRKQRAG